MRLRRPLGKQSQQGGDERLGHLHFSLQPHPTPGIETSVTGHHGRPPLSVFMAALRESTGPDGLPQGRGLLVLAWGFYCELLVALPVSAPLFALYGAGLRLNSLLLCRSWPAILTSSTLLQMWKSKSTS